VVNWVDPARILSEILSSGFSKIFMGKGKFHDHVTVLELFGSFLVEGQDEVAALPAAVRYKIFFSILAGSESSYGKAKHYVLF
jgi:hypothetical protein